MFLLAFPIYLHLTLYLKEDAGHCLTVRCYYLSTKMYCVHPMPVCLIFLVPLNDPG